MKSFFIKILLIISVFYFSDLYCMKKFLKRYICCCCCCCQDKDEEVKIKQVYKDFVEDLRMLTPEEIDHEIEEFAQQIKEQTKPSLEKLKEFFKKNHLKLKKFSEKRKKKK